MAISKKKYRRYSDEDILDQLREHYRETSKITYASFYENKSVCSGETVLARFGTWNKAVEKAGIKRPHIEYNKEKLIEMLKEKVQNGEIRSLNGLRKVKGIPSMNYIERHWGYAEIREALGLKKRIISYSDDYLIENYRKIKRMRKYKGKQITVEMFVKETGISNTVMTRHFGSWRKFLKLLKEKGNTNEISKVTHTNEELLKMYKEFSEKIGKGDTGATRKEVNEGFEYDVGVLEVRFGGLNNMRRLLGFYIEEEREGKYTKELLKEKLLEKYEQCRRKITQKEMKELAKTEKFPAIITFLRYFHTTKMSDVWNEILNMDV